MIRGSTGNLTPPSRIDIKGKKCYIRVRIPLVSDITLMTIGDIDVPKNTIGRSKASQGCFGRKEMKVAHS